jgi:predicted TIM-barrel fold metal-dependent hydrolase
VNLMSVEPGTGRPALGDTRCDPFWERIDNEGTAVTMHGASTGYHDLYSPRGKVTPRSETTAFQTLLSSRALLDSLTSLVLGDVFVRFPNVRVITVETGAWWVGPLLETFDHFRQGTGRTAPRDGASEVFRQHVYVNPFEYEVSALLPLLGAERICMGSDYPHPEGVGGPAAYAASLTGLPDNEVDLIMGGNTASLLGLTREARPTPASARS